MKPDTQDWHRLAKTLVFRSDAFIDGKYVKAVSGETFECRSPIDGGVLTTVAACAERDVDLAVAAARRAFDAGVWRDMPPKERKKVLFRLADLLVDNSEELALLETLDMGKPIRFSAAVDIRTAANSIRWSAEAIDKLYGEIAPTGPQVLALVNWEAIGVVGVVVPWNFPLIMAAWKVGPALAAGNSVVLKPAEQSPLSTIFLAELAVQAGIPAGVLNVVPGFGQTAGKAIGLHSDIDFVGFTGSTEVGKLFLSYSGQSNMKGLSLECGGKSPNIVFADAPNLDVAAKAAAFGIFFNQGEMCTAASRLLVQKSIKDEFLEKVITIGKTMQAGDPLDPKVKMGAIVDERQMHRVLGYIRSGVNAGARLALGGNQVRSETGGFYVEPTIFDDVASEMTIARDEIFGPVLSVLAFDDANDALRIANDTIYGLGAGVWTKDFATAHQVSRKLQSGTVWVNCYDASDDTVPFGGFKQSGIGHDRSMHALRKFSQMKTTWMNISA
ncbi:aldehyde dehydrogenase [Bradyrhizobium sp. Ash2021]|uniref:aldehyde dehydrogenase n=1 Tax=Bradyrhizobium sp. Ash2021 TaxID=2954771 RepID=UPI00281519A5|nr:aldehyde dehydrogenase [Bradyrhizobium sp. Ash2021]WMT76323.1 aldehyde dehydrogenase [Bradyrhizobium sp. Ash2021]